MNVDESDPKHHQRLVRQALRSAFSFSPQGAPWSLMDLVRTLENRIGVFDVE